MPTSANSFRVHLTNVTGIGASQLLASLLPAIERNPLFKLEHIYLPETGPLSTFTPYDSKIKISIYYRKIPNILSRILECTLLSMRFNGVSPLLVMGDLPLRCRGPQTLFVQSANLLKPTIKSFSMTGIKFWISRQVFRMTCDRVRAFIVQTEAMRVGLEKTYPTIAGRVYVVAQPVPTWLLASKVVRKGRVVRDASGLNLFYPAAGYPHKNHILLSKLDPLASWPVNRLALTLDRKFHPAPMLPWVDCRGFLSPEEMNVEYSLVDALLFLSKLESYGFPLIEAMFVGIPIVCPNLPYAREICGDQAIYFNADEPSSLLVALQTLEARLNDGWWPSWENQLSRIPETWEGVARQILEIACAKTSPVTKISDS